MIDGNHTRLSRWALIVLFGMAALAITANGYWIYHQQTHAIRETALNDLRAIAELKINQIAAWRNERLSDAFIFSTGLIRTNSLELLKAPKDAALKTAVLNRFEQVRQIRGYQNIIFSAPDGHILLSLDPNVLELEDVEKELVARTVSAREPVFGDLFRGQVSKNIHLDVAAPILDERQHPVGVIILRTDPEKTLYPLIQSWPLPSRSAETVLVRREGDTVLYLNVLRHRSDPALTISYPLSQREIPAVQAVLGKTGEFEGLDYRGIDVLSEVRPVPDSPWFMVSKIDMDEIMAMARYHGRMILFMIALGVFLTGIMAVYYFTYRQRNIYQRLFRAEREQRESREEIRATLYGIGDGVIATDSEGCVRRMNPVAESLTGWTETEALGLPLGQVFHIINEETRKEVENPVVSVLRDGLIVGLANHSVLIARDGTERPIADSGAPILDEEDNITGVVLVFRDQTEERAAQKALRDSEYRFRSSMDHMIEGCQIIDYDLRYIYINDACELHSRRPKEELLGNTFMDMWPDIEATELYQAIRRCLEERITTRMENEFTFPDGEKGWFDLSIQPVPEGALILSANITERMQAEADLIASRASLNRAQAIARLGSWEWDVAGSKLRWSEELYRIFGMDPHTELTYDGIIEQIHPDDRVLNQTFVNQLFESDDVSDIEFRIIRPDGSVRRIYQQAEVRRDENGNPAQIFGIMQDITERTLVEEALRASEGKYRSMFENMMEGVAYCKMLFDDQGHPVDFIYLDVNSTFEQLTGLKNVIGKRVTEVIPGISESDTELFEIYGRVASTGKPVKFERYLEALKMWFSLSVYSPERENFVAVFDVITERKQAEEALIQSEEQWRSYVENSPYGVFIADEKGKYIQVNPKACRVTGYDESELLTMNIPDLLAPESLKEAMADFSELAGTGKIHGEYAYLTKTGKQRWWSVDAVKLSDTRFLGFTSDITERKLAEELLSASEMKYRRLFEAARDGILILDAESGKILDVNPFLVELLGYSREKFLGKKLWEIGLFKDIAKSKVAFHELQKRGYIRYDNLPLKTADGQHRDVEFVSNVYPVGDRNVFQCNIRDITARKIAENTIKGLLSIVQEEKERLSIVINSIPDEVWFADTNKNFILANQAAQREFCLGPVDEIGVEELAKSMNVFRMDGSPRPVEEAAPLRALAGEIVKNLEEIVRTPLSGELRYRQVNATPVRDADGTIIGAVSVVRDITERKQAEEALQSLSLHQQTLLSSIPDIVTETDLNKVYTWINKSGIEFFGDDMIGKEASFYFVGEQDTYRIVQPLFDGEIDTVYVESLQRRKDGEERVLAWWSTALKDSQGNVTGSLSTAHDITDQKRAEETHDKLQARLLQSQKLEAIGTLAGGIAHDFNNILAAIIGYSELAIPEAPEGSQIRSDLEKIFQAGNRARDVVNQILTFSRHREEGKTPLHIAPFVKEVLKLLHATLPSTVSIVTAVESKTGMVLAEPSQIHQLVMNLCTNAAHAMKTSVGTLTVQLNEITLEDTDLAHYPTLTEGRYVQLIVSDTGHGMTKDIMERIFEPYFTTKGQGEGSGLGLSIVHGIVESIHGAISVYSEPGKGSTFKVYIPVTDQETKPDLAEKKDAYFGQGRILLIDDEPSIVEIGTRILTSLGYEVTGMTSSVDALEYFQQNHAVIDLVITDMTMPFIPGDELAKNILEIRPDMPIIICTGYSDRLSAEDAKVLGIQHYLSKPLLKSEIAEKVHEVLSPLQEEDGHDNTE